ncbi:response regulator [Oricola thermophila]|uniref:Response regulator n=1 Tax=Oricola thermophila TaxID=2742145 RepID=A0A6N1VFB3_9HYPH|nr:response regulator [Oricola thermophila]QKV19611.1 response regulator [Oricola thermophila]
MSKKVLTVDDSRTMREMLRHTLSSAGFEVVTAEDGADGIKKLEESQPDVVITDINMPVMDGFEFIENVRKNAEYNRVPILVLTTESAPEKKQRAQNAGATGWIVKPFDPEKLTRAVNRVMP